VGLHLELVVDLLFVRQNRAVEDVLEPGLKVAVEVGQHQDVVVLVELNIAVLFQHHAIHGQRSSLVRAQNVHGAEVLDGVQALDDDLLLRHRDGALGKAHRHDHGQHFRRHAHGHGQREEEGFVPVVPGEAVDEENQRNHHDHESDHQPGEAADALVEAGANRWPTMALAMLPR
jgi:hypothetical protein